MYRPSAAAGPSKAFSLVELLVVLAIIVVLASLLLPAMMLVRDAASRAVCANNMRQIGIAFAVYATDHAFFPPCQSGYVGETAELWGMWPWRIDQEETGNARLNRMFLCPTGNWRGFPTPVQIGELAMSSYGYALQVWSSAQGTFGIDHYLWPPGPADAPGRGVLPGRIRSHGQTILLAERWSITASGKLDHEVDIRPPNTLAPMDSATGRPVPSNPFGPAGVNAFPAISLRIGHRRTSNYLMVDGRVEALDFRSTMVLNTTTPPNRWSGCY